MTAARRALLTALAGAFLVVSHSAAKDPVRPPDAAELAAVREATRDLGRAVEVLQDEVVAELRGEQLRALYRQSDAVLIDATGFRKDVKPGITRARLYEAFGPLDRKVHDLLDLVNALGSKEQRLRRLGLRLATADEELHFAVYGREAADGQLRGLISRQARALASAARQLSGTAEYTLGTEQGFAVLLRELQTVAKTSEQLDKAVAAEGERPKLKEQLAAVNDAWGRATRQLQKLKADENIHLFRIADRADRALGRLYGLLGMNGERAQLLIRT